MKDSNKNEEELEKERDNLLVQLQDYLEIPMIILGFVWLALLIVELTTGLHPFLLNISLIIWGIFILDFLIKFIVATHKTPFLKKNVITIISLIIPAFRVIRIFTAFRALRTISGLRGMNLVKIIGSINRGMRALGATMSRRKFGYVLLLTLMVAFAGGAGMYAFEKDENNSFSGYWHALWWTFMIIVTMGSEYWPKSPEGRILCLLLAIYGFAVFGYFTATVATFFIGRDAEDEEAEIAGSKEIKELRREISLLREDLKRK